MVEVGAGVQEFTKEREEQVEEGDECKEQYEAQEGLVLREGIESEDTLLA